MRRSVRAGSGDALPVAGVLRHIGVDEMVTGEGRPTPPPVDEEVLSPGLIDGLAKSPELQYSRESATARCLSDTSDQPVAGGASARARDPPSFVSSTSRIGPGRSLLIREP
jgi:hypothetical protein